MKTVIRTFALAAAMVACVPAFAQSLTPVSRVEPEFPREAVQAGVDKGTVKAKLTIDGDGQVSRVEILDANPRRIFERAVVRALSQWKFSAGAAGRHAEVDLNFSR
ncbi:TonB family protein [Usitatibacter palustris]|uniref:TonB C-terminal domain-containing protein n=1 Tax=Usitatibacter palustris TaxID=2732487 RepID=A0A6M4H695_9PROT|nr:TonB family protein [Usitatibacter palustris]QJR15030.1 hypothetical protein DSM104440_01846 [Usitatibacter palustris]